MFAAHLDLVIESLKSKGVEAESLILLKNEITSRNLMPKHVISGKKYFKRYVKMSNFDAVMLFNVAELFCLTP